MHVDIERDCIAAAITDANQFNICVCYCLKQFLVYICLFSSEIVIVESRCNGKCNMTEIIKVYTLKTFYKRQIEVSLSVVKSFAHLMK